MAGPDQAAQHSTEVLHRTRKGPCPAKMAIGGFAIVATIGYFVVFYKEKPEASAVAKATAAVAKAENTRPR